MSDKRKILYILGSNRCGSTMLSSVLNGIKGLLSVGELRFFWERGLQNNWQCSCGQSFRECPFWAQISKRVEGQLPTMAPDVFAQFSQESLFEDDLMQRLIYLKNAGWFRRRHRETLAQSYRPVYDACFDAAASVRVLVDSSKVPQMVPVIRSMEGYEIYLLHMIRDPRAIVFSESFRRKTQTTKANQTTEMTLPVWLSMWRWKRINRQSDALEKQAPLRYLRLRYESFLEQPLETLRRIMRFIEEDETLAMENSGGFPVGDLHIFSGNPGRMVGPELTVRPDMEWRDKCPRSAKLLVSLTSRGSMRRYGYR